MDGTLPNNITWDRLITSYTYNESTKWTGKTKKSENHPISLTRIHDPSILSPVKQSTPNQESIDQIHLWRGLWVPCRCDAEKMSSPRPAIERTDEDHRRAPTTPRLAKSKVTSHAIPHAAPGTRACIYRGHVGGNRAFGRIFLALPLISGERYCRGWTVEMCYAMDR
jgi:hypothetical protein